MLWPSRSRLRVLTRCKISDGGSDVSDTEKNEDDDDFGDAEIKNTEEEEELEIVAKVYPGRSRKAKLDHNGERIWKALLVQYDGDELWYNTAEYTMTGIAAQQFFALQWTVRLRHTVNARIQLANSITETEVHGSAFCLGFWRFYRRLDAEQYIQWCNAHITLKARAVLGLPVVTGKEFLHLPPAEKESMLRKMGAYLMGIFDEKGNLIGWYAGSGTAKEEQGMFQRWTEGYDNVIDNARQGVQPTQSFSPSSYMQLLTKPGYTIHIRPVLLVEHARARKSHVIGFEGHLTDFVNGLNVELPAHDRNNRNEAVIASFPATVPPDMRDVPYRPLNLAHQHKQGIGSQKNLPCSMIGHGCSHDTDTRTWQMFQLDGELVFGCEVAYSSWTHARKHNCDMEFRELVNQWREAWRVRGLTGRYAPIPKDVCCASCSAGQEDTTMGRIRLNELPAPVLCRICRRLWIEHWKGELQENMDDAELEGLFNAFKDWIKSRVEERNTPEPECFCSTPEHQNFATKNAPGNFKWKDKHPKLCAQCHKVWEHWKEESSVPTIIKWQQDHPMDTYEQYKEYCLNAAAKRRLRATEIHCVCSTPAYEVFGTTKTPNSFEWNEQYPKFCADCSRAWRSVMSQRYHAGKGVASGLKFIKAHPMKSAEEFAQFSIVYSGRDKAEPEPEQQQEPESVPEEGGRGRRKRKPVQRFSQGISQHETMDL